LPTIRPAALSGYDPTIDRVKPDPLLDGLADNGGPTWTHALLPDSPAINWALPRLDVTTDQRGVLRPAGIWRRQRRFRTRHGRAREPDS